MVFERLFKKNVKKFKKAVDLSWMRCYYKQALRERATKPRNERHQAIYGQLEKRLNSSAFHADIHGFESRTGHYNFIL